MPKAVLYILSATLLFTALNICVKFLPRIPTSEIVLFRGLVTFIICFFYLKSKNVPVWGRHKKVLILRGLFGTISLFALFYSLQNMPMAMAMTLSNLAPLFTVVIAHSILKEKSHWLQFIFLTLAFIGVILVKGWSTDVTWPSAAFGIFGAFMAGCAYTCVRYLRGSEHPLVVMLYFPLLSFPLMIGPAMYDWVQPTLTEWGLLLLIGLLTQFAQYFMTLAYQLEQASKIMFYNYTGIIWAVLSGWFLFDETLHLSQIYGLGVVIFSLMASAWLALKMTVKTA